MTPPASRCILSLLSALAGLCVLASAALAARPKEKDDPSVPSAFDRIQRAYTAYMSLTDPWAFPMKARAIASSHLNFWRGGKDLFFSWAKDHTQDWMADKDAYVTQQGDPHFGNVGTYVADEGPFPTLAFG